MNQEHMNMEIRRFLKKAGVTSQREIEKAVAAAIANGNLQGNETLNAKMTLEITQLGLTETIAGTIALDQP